MSFSEVMEYCLSSCNQLERGSVPERGQTLVITSL